MSAIQALREIRQYRVRPEALAQEIKDFVLKSLNDERLANGLPPIKSLK
jgi:hypothetical protein